MTACNGKLAPRGFHTDGRCRPIHLPVEVTLFFWLVNRGSHLDLHKFVTLVLFANQVNITIVLLLDLFLRRHNNVVIVLHSAEPGENGHTNETIPFDAIDCERLCRHLHKNTTYLFYDNLSNLLAN